MLYDVSRDHNDDAGKTTYGDQTEKPEPHSVSILSLDSDKEDLGLLDVIDRLEEISEKIVTITDKLTSANNDLSRVASEVGQRFQNIAKYGDGDSGEYRKATRAISAQMKQAAVQINDLTPDFRSEMSRLTEISAVALSVETDFVGEGQQPTVPNQTAELESTLAEAILQFEGLANTVRGLPRLSIEFNASRRSYLEAVADVLEIMKRARLDLESLNASSKKNR